MTIPDATNPAIRGNPHKVPWYFRLLGLYRRQSHPANLDPEDYGDDTSSVGEPGESWLKSQLAHPIQKERKSRYVIYEEMDTFHLVTALLDAYTEEASQKDYDSGRVAWIESKSSKMVDAGDECLRNIQAEDTLPPVIRRMIKMGDSFQRLIYKTGKGVLAWRPCDASRVYRLQDKYNRLVGFREDGQTFRNTKYSVSWPWDYIHFRYLGKDDITGYGSSLLDPIFRPWRQLVLSEDSVLMYRLRRGPDRNLILVDVGAAEEHEASRILNTVRKQFKKHEYVDPASGNYQKQYNPINPLEDLFFAIRSEDQTRVESLSGSGNIDQIYDLNYFINAFFGAARAPKAYFGFEGEINSKSTLMQQDVRWARTIKRVQTCVIYSLRQTLDIHYTLLCDKPENDTFNIVNNPYLVQMSPISYLDEFERLELIQLRYQIIDAMSRLAQEMGLNAKVWSTYVLLNFAKLPEDLVLRLTTKPETPEGAGVGGAPGAFGFESVKGKKSESGFYPLNESEKAAISKIVHMSPALRKVIGDFAEYGSEFELEKKVLRQYDPSLLPPVRDGVVFEDSCVDDPEALRLQEDIKKVLEKNGTGGQLYEQEAKIGSGDDNDD